MEANVEVRGRIVDALYEIACTVKSMAERKQTKKQCRLILLLLLFKHLINYFTFIGLQFKKNSLVTVTY